jgi:hypothetical protein
MRAASVALYAGVAAYNSKNLALSAWNRGAFVDQANAPVRRSFGPIAMIA